MRVAIAGAGSIGRSIAHELISNGHQVLLIGKDPVAISPGSVLGVEWFQADTCEPQTLKEVELENCNVAIAVSGDGKVNLTYLLLTKTKFGVPRTVVRINHPGNERLLDKAWGVDVVVSMPRIMPVLMEGAVTTGDLVRLFTFIKFTTNLFGIRLLRWSPFVGHRTRDLKLPREMVLVTIIRDGIPLIPGHGGALETMDEILFVASQDAKGKLSSVFVSTD